MNTRDGKNGKGYLVVGKHPWNLRHFNEQLAGLPGSWDYVDQESELAMQLDLGAAPRFIFFLHWSSKVPSEWLERHECVCFHMTDVPYGRGGSPLQNLIARGHRETRLTALRMVEDFDAGPVYAKELMSLEGSTAEEIYIRASRLSCDMAARIAKSEPAPVDQTGEKVVFRRRKPEESRIRCRTLDEWFDHIRMLDAEGYPRAFLDHGGFRLTFRRASHYEGRVEAEVTIEERRDDG